MRNIYAGLVFGLLFAVPAFAQDGGHGHDGVADNRTAIEALGADLEALRGRVEVLEPTTEPDPVPVPDPTPDPDPIPDGAFADFVAAIPAGEMREWGEPWTAAESEINFCLRRYGNILAAWNGWSRDGVRYIWVAVTGGHADGCENAIYRYDIQAGKVERIKDHTPFTHGLDTKIPYVGDENGVQIIPRSSHTAQGATFQAPYHYLVVGARWKDGKSSKQVWRFDASKEDVVWERLPDRVDESGRLIGTSFPLTVHTSDGQTFLAGKWRICKADLASGVYADCQSDFFFSAYATIAWDEQRNGLWHVDPRQDRGLKFYSYDGSTFTKDVDLVSPPLPMPMSAGVGICVVPSEDGGVPYLYSSDGQIHKFESGIWTSMWVAGMPPPPERLALYNKWSWSPEVEACIGGDTVAHGLLIYKPGPSTATAPIPDPDPVPDPIPDPEPDPIPDPEPDPVPDPEPDPDPVPTPDPDPEPVEGVDLRDNWPKPDLSRYQPAAWTPAPWDQPIERLPEAPDYDALCPGEWAVLNFRTNEELAQSKFTIRATGKPNALVFVYPLHNAAGDIVAYNESVKADRINCLEVIAVPENGAKVQMTGNVALDNGVGLIVRGFLMAQTGNHCIGASGLKATNTQPAFIVLHDNEFYSCAGHTHFFGTASASAPTTYLEMIGNISAYANSHVIYIERSVIRAVFRSNVCFAPGWGHCLKNLAHESVIEGNVFSNVGIDGQVPTGPGVTRRHLGLYPLDLYACTRSDFRNNTVLFRTSNSVRTMLSYRSRRAWGGCNKGAQQADGSWPLLRTDSPEYRDEALWSEISAATADFDRGYNVAMANPWLFPHLVENNRFVVYQAFLGTDGEPRPAGLINVKSLRPVARNAEREVLFAEARALAESCNKDESCFRSQASPGLLYALDHMSPLLQQGVVSVGKLPRGVAIPAPENWTDRAAVYWGPQRQMTACDATGEVCAPWDAVPDLGEGPGLYDDVVAQSPRRLIITE